VFTGTRPNREILLRSRLATCKPATNDDLAKQLISLSDAA